MANRTRGGGNTSQTIKARQARRRRRKPGDLKAVLGKVWEALETAESDLQSALPDTRLRAAHAIFQGSSVYARLLEVGEFEARLALLFERTQALEQRMAEVQP